MSPGSSSFTDFLSSYAPDLLPGGRTLPERQAPDDIQHGTTIAALNYADGVVMAGDRRATMGNLIAQRDIEKVFGADEMSCLAFAGVAGIGAELVRLFQVELEHYEKQEGRMLSLEGKANRLATMIRSNLGMAIQGLAVVPVFAGYDEESDKGRIFGYDPTGDRYEEYNYHAIGSGSVFARGALKKLYRDDFGEGDAALAAIQALYDAADEDSATGGPDLTRRIYPVVAVVDSDGYRRLPEDEVARLAQSVVDGRMERADGPNAPLR